MIIPEPEPDPWWKFALNVAVGIVAVALVVVTLGAAAAPIALIAGACILGGTVIVSNTLQDIKSGQARGLGEMFLQTFQGSVAGAVSGAFGDAAGLLLGSSTLHCGIRIIDDGTWCIFDG